MNKYWLILLLLLILLVVEITWVGIREPGFSLKNLFYNNLIKHKHYNFEYPLNKESCYENLKIIHDVFVKHNIFFWLGEGTALGFTRDNDFISWDDDLDIGIYFKDKDKFLNCIEDLKKFGFRLGIIINNNFYSFMRGGERIDIELIGNNLKCISCSKSNWDLEPCEKILPFLKFKKINIRGKVYNIPKEEYLEALYGKDWMIPKKKSKVIV